MNTSIRWSWYALLACVVLTPLATSATSMRLTSLPLTFDQFVIPKMAALGVTSALALALWAAGAPSAIRWHRSAWTAMALVGLAAVSTVFAIEPAVALFGRDAANGLVAWASAGAAFFLVLQHVSSAGRVRALARGLVAAAAVVCLFSLYQAATVSYAYLEDLGLTAASYLYGRGGGVMGNPDFLGAFLVVPFPLALALAIGERDLRLRWASGVGATLIGATLVVAQVRGAWIGAVVGAAVLVGALLARRAVRARQLGVLGAIAVAGTALGSAVATLPLLFERVARTAGGSLNQASSGRLEGWSDALRVIADRPVLGTGPDLFTLGWYQRATALADRVTGAATYLEDPHNVYLAVAATLGVPALLALLTLLVLAARSGIASVRVAKPEVEHVAPFAGWLAALAGLAAASVFAVTTVPLTLLLFVCTAVLLAPSAGARTPQGGIRTGLRAGSGLLAAVLLILAALPLTADFQMGQYMRTKSQAALDAARSIAPWEKNIQLAYLDAREAEVLAVLSEGGQTLADAADRFDVAAFELVQAHPHELQYQLVRNDMLGRVASLLGGQRAEKAFAAATQTALDHPKLVDTQIARARAMNSLGRFSEARGVLEALPTSVMRDAALVETYLLLKDETAARTLLALMREAYVKSPVAEAFFAQEAVAPYLRESGPETP